MKKNITVFKGQKKEESKYPITIQIGKGRQVGISYSRGKYRIHGKEYMDEGVQIFFQALTRKFEYKFLKEDKEK